MLKARRAIDMPIAIQFWGRKDGSCPGGVDNGPSNHAAGDNLLCGYEVSRSGRSGARAERGDAKRHMVTKFGAHVDVNEDWATVCALRPSFATTLAFALERRCIPASAATTGKRLMAQSSRCRRANDAFTYTAAGITNSNCIPAISMTSPGVSSTPSPGTG